MSPLAAMVPCETAGAWNSPLLLMVPVVAPLAAWPAALKGLLTMDATQVPPLLFCAMNWIVSPAHTVGWTGRIWGAKGVQGCPWALTPFVQLFVGVGVGIGVGAP